VEQTTTRGPGETAAPNLLVRVGQVFAAPGRLFEALAARPVWLDVFLLLIASTVASQLVIPEETFRAIFMQQIPADTPPEQIERILSFTRTWGLVIGAVSLPLALVVVAGLLILAYNVMLGGDATFRQLFSATAHAFLILSAGGWIVLALILLGSEQVVLSPFLALEGFLDLGDGYLARIAYRINIFAVWTCAVLGIAVGKLYPKRSAGGATTYLLVLYLLLVAVSALQGG